MQGNVKDRGGLWKVRAEVCKIFSVAELMFKSSCSGFVRSINAQQMVEMLVTNTEILSNYSTICSDVPEVEKEISLNLLEHMLTFSFSYAKQGENSTT